MINATRVPIERKESLRWLQTVQQSSALLGEPGRCVHIGDRESDIPELFCAVHETGAHFLLRTCVNRLAKAGTTTVEAVMAEVPVTGLHRIEVRDKKGAIAEAVLEV